VDIALQQQSKWIGGLAEWIEGDTAYLSIAFTWKLDEARDRADWYRRLGYKVKAGGPATFVRKKYSPTMPSSAATILMRSGAITRRDHREPRVSGRLLVLHRAEDGGEGVHAAP
jgi:hypothetical protein